MNTNVLVPLAAYVMYAYFMSIIIFWVWNKTIVRAVTWANPISRWDAIRIVVFVVLSIVPFIVKIGVN